MGMNALQQKPIQHIRLPHFRGLQTRLFERISLAAFFMLLVYVILIIKLVTLELLNDSFMFAAYNILVAVYILSRYFLAYFYDPKVKTNRSYMPSITFVTPAKNEEENIARAIACMAASDYPKNLIEIITIDDRSTDNTYSEMLKAAAERHTSCRWGGA